jgi:hypothetical protein
MKRKRFRSLSRHGSGISLTWSSIPRRSYRVQYREHLANDFWRDLPGDLVATAGSTVREETSITDSAGRFFRIILLPK